MGIVAMNTMSPHLYEVEYHVAMLVIHAGHNNEALHDPCPVGSDGACKSRRPRVSTRVKYYVIGLKSNWKC